MKTNSESRLNGQVSVLLAGLAIFNVLIIYLPVGNGMAAAGLARCMDTLTTIAVLGSLRRVDGHLFDASGSSAVHATTVMQEKTDPRATSHGRSYPSSMWSIRANLILGQVGPTYSNTNHLSAWGLEKGTLATLFLL